MNAQKPTTVTINQIEVMVFLETVVMFLLIPFDIWRANML